MFNNHLISKETFDLIGSVIDEKELSVNEILIRLNFSETGSGEIIDNHNKEIGYTRKDLEVYTESENEICD